MVLLMTTLVGNDIALCVKIVEHYDKEFIRKLYEIKA